MTDTPSMTNLARHTPSDIPDFILSLDSLYLAELAAFRRAEIIASESRDRWAATGLTSGMFTTPSEPELALFDALFAHVIGIAATHLSQGGATPVIDMTDWRASFLCEIPVPRAGHRTVDQVCAAERRANLMSFRPSALWAAILEAYPSERVEHDVCSRAATVITKALQLRGQQEIRRVGGRVEIIITAWSEPKFSKPDFRTYSYNTTRDFRGLEEAFSVLANASALTDPQDTVAGLGKALDALSSFSFTFQSRDRIDLAGGMTIQFFNNAIKVLIPQHIASALNLFLATYAPLS